MDRRGEEWRVLLDLDGVLVDCVGSILEWHGLARDLCESNLGSYDLAGAAGVSWQDLWSPAMRHAFWADLSWMHDGKDILQAACSLVAMPSICLLTTPIPSPWSCSGKYEWVQEQMPGWEERLLIGPSKHFCAGPRSVLIDDSDANVEKFREAGGHAVLVPRAWNSNFLHRDNAVDYVYSTAKGIMEVFADA